MKQFKQVRPKSFLLAVLSIFIAVSGITNTAFAGTTSGGTQPFSSSNYRFYGQSAATAPGSPLASTNTAASLSSVGEEFRLRMGVESPSTNVVYMGIGRDYGCLMTEASDVYCWGSNYSGAFGNGTTTDSLTPQKIDFGGAFGTEKITQLSVGYDTTCAVTDAAALYCWGSNYWGEIGDGNHNIFSGGGNYDALSAFRVSDRGGLAGKGVLQVSTGTDTVCALADDHRVYCWGDNQNSQTGTDTFVDNMILTPTAVDTGGGSPMNGKDIVEVGTNQYISCALDTAGKVYCWGYNFFGELGNGGSGGYNYQPVAVDMTGVLAGKTVKKLAIGQLYGCVIASDDLGYCWGYNGHGNLADGTSTARAYPVAMNMSGLTPGLTVKSISANVSSTCIQASDNNVYCTGETSDSAGYMGLNVGCGGAGYCDILNLTPVYTGGLLSGKTVKHVATHFYSTCVVTTEDRLYCSGDNSAGELGDGTTTPSTQMVGGTRISYDILAATNSYQLEYASLTAATCEAQTTGYATVTGATPVAYVDVSGVSSGTAIANETNDPTSVATTTPQALYGSSGTVATISDSVSGNTSLWDYSLVDNGMTAGQTYCLRMAYDGGAPLEDYPHVAAVQAAGTAPPGGTGGSGTGGTPGSSSDSANTPSLADTGMSTPMILALALGAVVMGGIGSVRLRRRRQV